MSYVFNLGQFFSSIAHKNASHIAIKTLNSEYFSFIELEKASNRVANYIIGEGIKKGDVIAILNNKTFTAYALMLACLKVGVVYTNLDPKSPVERFKKMIDVCRPKWVFYSVADGHAIVNEVQTGSIHKTDYTSVQFQNEIAVLSDQELSVTQEVTGDNPAYIMFTSGSTGFPKGVVISHGSLINFINWSRETYGISNNDVLTNLNPMHFDNSVFDFYASLFNGAAIIPTTEDLTINPRKLLDELNKLQPSIWFSVPSMLVYALNMRAIKESDLTNLRVVTFGGEGFPKNKLRELWNKWGNRVRFVNVYGPTEGTCICSSYDVSESDLNSDDLLPLGPIAPNFSAYILDENNAIVGDEETGELCIGGPNLALGYFNNPVKTAEAFIQNPFVQSHTERIYRTGDLVSFNKELNVFNFRGRKDNQIKRMGYRIELEEIENAFNTIEYIEEAAVVYADNPNYKTKIIACIKTVEGDETKIRNAVSKHLPQYMMPDLICFYNSLPKNQNGKIDRLAIKAAFN